MKIKLKLAAFLALVLLILGISEFPELALLQESEACPPDDFSDACLGCTDDCLDQEEKDAR